MNKVSLFYHQFRNTSGKCYYKLVTLFWHFDSTMCTNNKNQEVTTFFEFIQQNIPMKRYKLSPKYYERYSTYFNWWLDAIYAFFAVKTLKQSGAIMGLTFVKIVRSNLFSSIILDTHFLLLLEPFTYWHWLLELSLTHFVWNHLLSSKINTLYCFFFFCNIFVP